MLSMLRFLAPLVFLGFAPSALAQCAGEDSFEPNDTCPQAAVTNDGGKNLSVYKSDPDWYQLRVPPLGIARIDVFFTHLVANVDARVWDACGGVLLAEGNSVTDNEILFAVNLTLLPRDYWLEVFVNPASSGECNDYDLTIDGAGTNLGANYCTAALNSTGLPALMSAAGSLSISDNNLKLFVRTVPARQFGLFYYGPQQIEIPFGNGYRCVGPGELGTFLLLPPDRSNQHGQLFYQVDLSAPPDANGQILPGSTWYFQAFYRDPFAQGYLFNFSDGLGLTFLP